MEPAVLEFANPSRTNWDVDEAWVVDPDPQPVAEGDATPVPLFDPEKGQQVAAARLGIRPLWLDGVSALQPALATLTRRSHPETGF